MERSVIVVAGSIVLGPFAVLVIPPGPVIGLSAAGLAVVPAAG